MSTSECVLKTCTFTEAGKFRGLHIIISFCVHMSRKRDAGLAKAELPTCRTHGCDGYIPTTTRVILSVQDFQVRECKPTLGTLEAQPGLKFDSDPSTRTWGKVGRWARHTRGGAKGRHVHKIRLQLCCQFEYLCTRPALPCPIALKLQERCEQALNSGHHQAT